MRGWNSEARRASTRLKAGGLAILMASALAGAAAASTTAAADNGLPAGATPLSAAELYALYHDKSWQWPDGAGRMDTADRRFTAWVDGEKGKSWAEGRWQITDAGNLCFTADWHVGQEVFPARTCFAHRVAGGTIYQKKEPEGQWVVFRHAPLRADDEATKLVSEDIVSGRLDEFKSAPPALKQQAKQ
ncbi:DUF995 domain-containing protein [Kaistia sp. K-TC2]|uniref:DUF995 domain-containing protein n=2 Tax=Kaistia nematophila TaxID=2994654 RepID=A0A9X3E368_9HYPH|nr:DUF995 domain-containing protein [Kaistia nematophila]MCX5570376.1 DUF995 domain-containing protein [Kaistia nematophila]